MGPQGPVDTNSQGNGGNGVFVNPNGQGIPVGCIGTDRSNCTDQRTCAERLQDATVSESH